MKKWSKPCRNPSLLLVFLFCTSAGLTAQNDPAQYAHELFRGTRIVNGHSVETLQSGEMEMIIGHRFGRLNTGTYDLFGLDVANIRLGLDYGFRDWLNVGFGRSSLGKEYDAFVKLRLLRQAAAGYAGSPFSLTGFASTAYNSLRASNPEQPLQWQNRLTHTFQLLVARQFHERFSMQLMPTYIHSNLVPTASESNGEFSLGVAAKYQLSKNLALTMEHYLHLPNQYPVDRRNVFSFGFDINTGSHVFQLHFTNAAGMIEKQFIGETTGDWLNGDIHFGFNMIRTFKLRGRRY